jgi:hypothetical protein
MMVNELLQGFTSLYHLVDLKTDTPYCLRPNLGVTIVASMFEAKIELRGDQPPWVRPLGSMGRIREISRAPVPDANSGLLPRALEQYAYFKDALSDYPKCQAAFQLTLPDLQGPFDIAELLWGSGIFLAFYDDPELLMAFLGKITDTILLAHRCLIPEVQEDVGPDCQYQHSTGVKGRILIRGDTSVIMLSPGMYEQYIMPCDTYLAEKLGGVGLHFCGDGSHQLDNLLKMRGLECIDFGQSYMMEIDKVYAQARQRKIALSRIQLPDEALVAADAMRRFPTGVNLLREVDSVAEAEATWKHYIGRQKPIWS